MKFNGAWSLNRKSSRACRALKGEAQGAQKFTSEGSDCARRCSNHSPSVTATTRRTDMSLPRCEEAELYDDNLLLVHEYSGHTPIQADLAFSADLCFQEQLSAKAMFSLSALNTQRTKYSLPARHQN